jgi:hypothetical protein
VFVSLIGLLLTHFLKHGGNFNDNIVPELIGFCLDGIFFVILLNYFERRQTRAQSILAKQTLKAALRESLIIFLQWSYTLASSKGADLDAHEILFSPTGVEKLIERITKAQEIPSLLNDYLKQAARQHVAIMGSLLPVAAQIDRNHIGIWSMIIKDVSSMAESKDGGEMLGYLEGFLHNIRVFDRMRIQGKD